MLEGTRTVVGAEAEEVEVGGSGGAGEVAVVAFVDDGFGFLAEGGVAFEELEGEEGYDHLGGGHLGRLRPFLHGPGEHVAYPARRLDLFHTVQLSDGCRQRGKPLDIIAVAQHKQSLRDAVGKPHPAVEVGIAAAALDEIHERFGAYFKGNVGMKILHKPISENRFVDRWENGLSMD